MKKRIFRRVALLVSLLMLVTSTVNTTYGLIVTKTPSLVNIFTPFDSAMSDLVIHKVMEHPFGEDYTVPDNGNTVFDFKVELGSLYANTTIQTGSGNIVADESGALTVSVKGNSSVGIIGIDAGTKVTVTELSERAGFTVKGDAVQTVTIPEGEQAKLTFTNIYKPSGTNGAAVDVVGTKNLEGRDWEDGDVFTVVLEQYKNESWVRLGYQVIDGEDKDFDLSALMEKVSFDLVGEYEFRVRELAGDLSDMDYDEEPKPFTVRVTDRDMDGALEVGAVNSGGGAQVSAANGAFTVDVLLSNIYVAPVDVTVTVDKTVTSIGEKAIGPEGFEFILENTENKEQSKVVTDKNGHAALALRYGLADAGKTFTYTLSESRGDVFGVSYDDAVYTIAVSVAREGNAMTADVAVNGTAVKVCEVAFENIYDSTQTATPPTGDTVNLLFWLAMMIVSGAASVVLVVLDRRDRVRR